MDSSLAIIQDSTLKYPTKPPYNPSFFYPEYSFDRVENSSTNFVYDSVRQLFVHLKLDIENFGKKEWNPFGKYVKPGNKIVIKPNWVHHINPIEDHINGLISHSSVIRAIMDYLIIALKDEGTIIIGDAPIQSCNFDILMSENAINEIVKFLQPLTNVKIEVKDFRKEIMISKYGRFKRIENSQNQYTPVNLAHSSFLSDIKQDYTKFRVTSYDKDKMRHYHNTEDHIYLIASDVLEADVVIEIPKLKTHRKAGITCSLKNNVGINAFKDCLVHHRKGSKEQGGDAYLKKNYFSMLKEALIERYDKAVYSPVQLFYKSLLKLLKKGTPQSAFSKFFEGSWYGNDTLWRTILDLNRIVFFSDRDGIMHRTPQRIVLYLVDGIIGGEGEGPLKPKSISSGILALGTDPLLTDACMATVIGYDINKIPSIYRALSNELFNYNLIELQKKVISLNGTSLLVENLKPMLKYSPSAGWLNQIEIK